MILSLALATALVSTQQINCFPAKDLDSPDRLVMSLQLPSDSKSMPTNGTLFLSSGIDDDGRHDNSGVMQLDLIPASDEDLKARTVRYISEQNVSNFIVTMNEADIGKTLKSFSIQLTLERVADHYRVDQELVCYATVFSE